ncbi:MAG: hypothetical protein PVJ83_08185, partial [Gammaproteobacteria bacterium]
ELLSDAGLTSIETQSVQVGYHLKDEQEWWEVVQNTAIRFLFERLPPEQRDAARAQHLAFVADQKTADGLWMDVQTRFASGLKPPR